MEYFLGLTTDRIAHAIVEYHFQNEAILFLVSIRLFDIRRIHGRGIPLSTEGKFAVIQFAIEEK